MTHAPEEPDDFTTRDTEPRRVLDSHIRPKDLAPQGGRWHPYENFVGEWVVANFKIILVRDCGGVQKRLGVYMDWPESALSQISYLLRGERSVDLRWVMSRLQAFGLPSGGVALRAAEWDEIRTSPSLNCVGNLRKYDIASETALNARIDVSVISRWARRLLAVNGSVKKSLFVKSRTSHEADPERIIERINNRPSRLEPAEARTLIGAAFFGRDISHATSDELARLVAPGTTVQVVEHLPAPWVYDPVSFEVWVRDTGDDGLNEHRACEAMISYALRDVRDIHLGHETDVCVWRYITNPAHEAHRLLRERVVRRCKQLKV